MPKYAIKLAYDGTDFCGWQAQRGKGAHRNAKPSLEEALSLAISELCETSATVVASGRTDAGVHASGQVAHFSLSKPWHSEENLRLGLNHLLPDTFQINQLAAVPDSFSARKASGKQYWNSPKKSDTKSLVT